MKPSTPVSVAPLTVLPFQKAIFSYTSKKPLAIGTLVSIPLSGRTVEGVVVAEESLGVPSSHELKNITAVIDYPPLTQEQIALAQEISRITFTPLGKVLKHFVPKKASARKSTAKNVAQETLTPFPKNALVQSVVQLLAKEDACFLPLASHQDSLETLGGTIQTIRKNNEGQVLVIVPDIYTAVRLETNWRAYFDSEILVSLYHTKTAGQYFEAWEKVRSGTAKVIIATRHGMFAPFQNLVTILQLDPNDEAYKQWDMSPRYHAQFVLPVLQKIWGAKFIQTAPLQSLTATKENLPTLPSPAYPVNPEWINLKIERWQKNWSAFSIGLQTAIKEALAEKKQIILYAHQSGLESFSVCTECRTIFRCPSCKGTLKLTASDHYHCKNCGFKSALFPQCPECKNIHFKSVGYGTEKVAREIKKLFPGATVAIADKKHLENHKKIHTFLSTSTKNEPDILIATNSFLRFPPLSRPFLAAIIDADTLLNLPGFRKDEQFIELVVRLKSLLEPKGRLLIQTFRPEGDLFQKISKEPAEVLWAQLLEERLLLRYPPYYRATILEVRPQLKDGKQVLTTVGKKLRELISQHPEKKNILIQSTTRRIRGKEETFMLLRYKDTLPPEITAFLARHAEKMYIDSDPLHIS